MLSAANLLALEDVGFRFIVGSKSSKALYDLADHLERHGNAFDDGQTLETTRTVGTGKKARDPVAGTAAAGRPAAKITHRHGSEPALAASLGRAVTDALPRNDS
jgi:hypothetical protein